MSRTKRLIVVGVVAATCALSHGCDKSARPSAPRPTFSATSKPAAGTIQLNLLSKTYTYDLQASADGRWASFDEATLDGMAPTLRIHLVNLTTGKVIDTEPNMGRCLLSPVGEKAALVRIGRSTILDLKTMKETEVPRQGEPPAVLSEPGFWMGNKAILVDMGPAQTHVGLGFYGLKSYDPADGKIAKLSSVGFPIASDAAGTTLLALVDTGAPQKPIVGDKKEATSYYLVCLDARGDIQKKVVCGESFKGSAVISPSGRWIAYDEKGGKDAIITILDIDTGVTASISAAAHPIGATDRGTVVLKQDRVGDDPNTPTALKLLRSGKIVDFIDAACSATVAGDRLFYIVGGGDKAVLTSIDIPEN